MTPAERTRRWRARQRSGLARLTITVDEVELAAALVAAGRLRPELADDRQALERALEGVIADLAPTDIWAP